MLQTLLERELEKQHLSVRAASREMNITHTTLHRVLRGEPVDLDTVITLCKWLNVRPSTILDIEANDETTSVSSAIAALIEQDERLASVFIRIANDLGRGSLSVDDVKDVVSYAAYRLGNGDKQQSTLVHGGDRSDLE